MSKYLIDTAIPAKALVSVYWVAVAMLSIGLIEFVITRLSSRVFADLSIWLKESLDSDVLSAVLCRSPVSAPGRVIVYFGDTKVVSSMVMSSLSAICVDLPFAAAGIWLAAMISWPLALLLLMVSIAMVTYSALHKRRLSEMAHSVAVKKGTFNNWAIAATTHLETIFALRRESAFGRKLCGANSDRAEADRALSFRSVAISAFSGLMSRVGSILGIVVASFLVISGEMTVGGLISFSLLSAYFAGPINRLAAAIESFATFKASLERLENLLAKKKRIERTTLPRSIESIEFRNVSFRYSDTTMDVLTDRSFTLRPGTITSIVGQSGAGKSTALKLICGVLKPTTGDVIILDSKGREVRVHESDMDIGYLPQSEDIFPCSVIENVALFGVDDVGSSRQDLYKLFDVFGLDELSMQVQEISSVASLSTGGPELSGGQRQRVKLVRAILSGSHIIVLDEPSTYLDANMKKATVRFLRGLKSSNVVIVVATHDEELIELSDNTIALADPRTTSVGSQ